MKWIVEKSLYRYAGRVVLKAHEDEIEFGGERWRTAQLLPGRSSEIELLFADGDTALSEGGMYRFRIAVAGNVRGTSIIRAVLPRTGALLARFDIRWGYRMQLFEAPLSHEEAGKMLKEGALLYLDEGEPVELVVGMSKGTPSVFSPHLACGTLSPSIPMFLRHLAGSTSFHPSGWMEGCVLEGLYDLYAATGHSALRTALEEHLDAFLMHKQSEDHRDGTRVIDGKIVADVIEQTLPAAVLSRLRPDHPMIAEAIALWRTCVQEDDAVFDYETRTLSAEGAYTVAYPMAVAAAVRRDVSLARLALRQLLARRKHLTKPGAVYLRRNMDSKMHTFRNWSRGCAWYMLGFAKTMATLEDAWPKGSEREYLSDELEVAQEAFREAACLAAKYQDCSGLWFNFWDRPESGLETSGSAGTAAALAIGARRGWLDDSYMERARCAWRALLTRIGPDGLLTGIAQTNQGGEALQLSGYRTLFPMGMGLAAQLGAALKELDVRGALDE